MDMQIDKRLVIRESEGVRVVYASRVLLHGDGRGADAPRFKYQGREPEESRKKLLQIQKEESIGLDEKQVQAGWRR